MKILVVDDSRMMRHIIRNELEAADFQVVEAVNGFDALEKVIKEEPSLITMDVDMPEMNGFDAVYKIRTDIQPLSVDGEKEVPIVFVTANDTIEGRQMGFEVGATDFIIKPFLKGEIAATVNSLLKPDTTLQGMTALIVEDSDITRSILNNILKGEGVTTILSVNGQDGFEKFKVNQQNIDLVITDFMMPEMDGDELCKKIRFELGNRSVPIIFLSALSEKKSMLKIFKAGASDYVVKPFAKEELLARIGVHFESRMLNKKLFDQVQQLKRLNKLKDDLISVTSHDLRSPLNGILGFTKLLIEDNSVEDKHKEYLRHVKDSGDFLLNLINDILDLGQAQSEKYELDMKTVQVMDLIESSTNTVRHMATPKNIELKIKNKSGKKPILLGNKDALIRIFNNLLSNAIKFTPNNGEVRQVIEETSDGKLAISFIDNGIGVPKGKIPYLFDRFSKISRLGTAGEKSTGLGLSITKELIERHNGTITVTSKEGKGTCFKIVLPLPQKTGSQNGDSTNEKLGATNMNREPSDIRVLVADDNQLNLKLVKTIMQKHGYAVSTVADGKEALECYIESLEENADSLDLIFMDLRMPIMDGFESTMEIRKYEKANQVSSIPIIAMTAGTDDAWKRKSIKMGLNGFITKPINIKQIEELVQQFILVDKDDL